MNNSIFTPRFLAVCVLMVVAAATRFLPHPPNFTAVGALALFGAANLQNKKLAIILPLLVMAFTDLFIPYGFDSGVYISFIITGFIGIAISNNVNFKNVVAGSLASSVVFFLITNLVIWNTISPLYPMTLAGQMESYTMALPFFQNTLLGDLFFNGAFFGGFALLKRSYPVLAQ